MSGIRHTIRPLARSRRKVVVSRTAVVAGVAVAVLGLAGCSGSAETATSPSTAASSLSADATSTDAAQQGLTLEDGWAKAGEGMTGVFGTLRNAGDEPVTITGGSSPVAGVVETHTMQMQNGAMVMVKDEDGFTVEPGGSYALAPGEDHIMLVELSEPLATGENVTITLTTDTGEATFTVPVREFAGADEEYAPGHGMPAEGAAESGSHGGGATEPAESEAGMAPTHS